MMEIIKIIFYKTALWTGIAVYVFSMIFLLAYLATRLLNYLLRKFRMFRTVAEYIFFRKKFLKWFVDNKGRVPDSEDIEEHKKY